MGYIIFTAIWLALGFIGVIGWWFYDKHQGVTINQWVSPGMSFAGPFVGIILVGILVGEALQRASYSRARRRYWFRKLVTGHDKP